MTHQPPPRSRRRPARVHNRIVALAIHVPRYSVNGLTNLAADAGVSRRALRDLLLGAPQPSYAVACKVAKAFSAELGQDIRVEELLSLDGTYPTRYPCRIFGCRCLPPWCYDEEEGRIPASDTTIPGQWIGTGHPRYIN